MYIIYRIFLQKGIFDAAIFCVFKDKFRLRFLEFGKRILFFSLQTYLWKMYERQKINYYYCGEKTSVMELA